MPKATAPEEADPDVPLPAGQPYKVYTRWVTDSEKFNEWMNPIDYEVDSPREEGAAGADGAGTSATAG